MGAALSDEQPRRQRVIRAEFGLGAQKAGCTPPVNPPLTTTMIIDHFWHQAPSFCRHHPSTHLDWSELKPTRTNTANGMSLWFKLSSLQVDRRKEPENGCTWTTLWRLHAAKSIKTQWARKLICVSVLVTKVTPVIQPTTQDGSSQLLAGLNLWVSVCVCQN